jgi:hypothetical protein
MRWLRPVGFLLLTLAAGLLPAAAQVTVAPGMVMRLSADASAGYVASSAQGGLNSFHFGLSANLSGYYYHPNFLHFQISPFYNHGREYSGADYITGDKGIGASLNLFGGSNIPLSISYFKNRSRSGMYGLVGSEPNVVGEGSNDNLTVNWTLRLRRLPSLQFGYMRNGGDYRLFGANASHGRSLANGYTLAAQHILYGFVMVAAYSNQKINQTLPGVLFSADQALQTQTWQKNLQLSLSRQVGKSVFFDATANRSRWSTDATGRHQERNYDTLSTGLSFRPNSRLSTTLRYHHTSDLGALLLGSVLPGGPGAGSSPLLVPLEQRSRYDSYSAAASYLPSEHLSFRTNFRRGRGRYSGRAGADDTTLSSGADFRHELFGGRLSGSYVLNLYSYANGNAETSSQGHAGTLVFSRMFAGWDYTALFQYSTADIESQIPGWLRNLTTEFSSAGGVRGWRLVGSYRYEKADTVFNHETDNRRHSFRVSLSRPRINLTGTVQVGSGLSIITQMGLQPASLTQAYAAGSELERLLIPTDTRSYTFTSSYVISRRTNLAGSWMRTRYTTRSQGTSRENHLGQLDIYLLHWFRQLEIRVGFRRYDQLFSIVGRPYVANTFYFQVRRHFDVF